MAVRNEQRNYLVVGALGLVGRAVVEALEDQDGCEAVAVSRRQPDFPTRARFLQLDLTDRAACRQQLGRLDGVTHIVYAALYEKPDLIAGWRDDEQIETNTRMLANVLDFVTPARHLTLLQGTKAYGAHLAPMKLPGKESDPRHPGANFYWSQEDLLREASAGADWTFSIMRPQIVCGHALGSPMNMVSAIGVHAAVLRELGQPLRFPGRGGFVTEATDARLLARAILWAGSEPRCAGEAFNITNGDILDWGALFPEIADHFQMPCAAPEPLQLSEAMPKHSAVWDQIVARHGLAPHSMDQLIGASWQFADAVFGYHGGQTTLLSTVKARQFGFAECIDTATMFREHFIALHARKVLPP